MKTQMFKFSVLIILGVIILHIESYSQSMKIGGGLILETGRPPFGFHVKGTYDTDNIFEKSRISADIGFMFPQTVNLKTYNRAYLNVDANYDFYTIEDFSFYALAGLNFTYYNSTVSNGFLPGLTGGAGVFYNLTNNLTGYSEVKNTFFGYGEAALTFGLLFKL